MPLMTSLKAIYNNPYEKPCKTGITTLREFREASVLEAHNDDTPFPISDILKSNGIGDTFWVIIHCVTEYQEVLCSIITDIAELLLKIFESARPNDSKPREALEALKDFKLSNYDLNSAEINVVQSADIFIRSERKEISASAWGIAHAIRMRIGINSNNEKRFILRTATRVIEEAIFACLSTKTIEEIIKKHIGE